MGYLYPMSNEPVHFKLRIPSELFEKIKERAAASHRSATAEITRVLEASFLEKASEERDIYAELAALKEDNEMIKKFLQSPEYRKGLGAAIPFLFEHEKQTDKSQSKPKPKKRGGL